MEWFLFWVAATFFGVSFVGAGTASRTIQIKWSQIFAWLGIIFAVIAIVLMVL